MTKRKKIENLAPPTKLNKNSYSVRLIGKKKPMIAFGCGAIKVSEQTLDATIGWLEDKDKLKSSRTKINNEIIKRQSQISTLQKEIYDLSIKLNKLVVPMPKLVRSLNTRCINNTGKELEGRLINHNVSTREVKLLKRFFINNKKVTNK